MHDDRILSTERTLPYAPEAVYAAFASGPTLAPSTVSVQGERHAVRG